MINQQQSIRIGYMTFPTDYINELNQSGRRKKARCFMEYNKDMQDEVFRLGVLGQKLEKKMANSYGFYAKSWEVSKATAFEWIEEFFKESGLFHAHWINGNSQYYSSVQKAGERLPNDNADNKTPTTSGLVDDLEKTTERLPNEVLNISSSNSNTVSFFDGEFEDMFFGCRISNKKVGKKDEIYKEYQKHKQIKHKYMRFAYLCYLSDRKAAKDDRYFGLVNFMRNQVYLNYLNPQVRIELDDKVLEGIYNKETSRLVTGDEFYTLTHERFIELIKNEKICFIGAVA
jgi:hypothetical protein